MSNQSRSKMAPNTKLHTITEGKASNATDIYFKVKQKLYPYLHQSLFTKAKVTIKYTA